MFYSLAQEQPEMSMDGLSMREQGPGFFIGFFSYFIGVCPPLL